jgi:hypothetical protein
MSKNTLFVMKGVKNPAEGEFFCFLCQYKHKKWSEQPGVFCHRQMSLPENWFFAHGRHLDYLRGKL